MKTEFTVKLDRKDLEVIRLALDAAWLRLLSNDPQREEFDRVFEKIASQTREQAKSDAEDDHT
jgi:hypothetical protein